MTGVPRSLFVNVYNCRYRYIHFICHLYMKMIVSMLPTSVYPFVAVPVYIVCVGTFCIIL